MEDLTSAVLDGPAVVARVVAIKGFSTVAVDELVAVDASGRLHGDLLGRPGAEKLRPAAAALLEADDPGLATLTISIHGAEVAELGLSCGGQAEVLLQPAAAIPRRLWELRAARQPAALITRVDGPEAGPIALVVDRDGHVSGSLKGVEPLIEEARALLQSGRTAYRRVEDALIEAWVPTPRLVVVGTGDMVSSLRDQAALLGWEIQSTESPDDLTAMFDWAGGTAALVVLSHDPHTDAPALAAGLDRGVAYLGAMGSRGTQSRRLERLATLGYLPEQLDRIHRPIGLDLGGRGAPEVALAIVAEILAVHCGRSGQSLRDPARALFTASPILG